MSNMSSSHSPVLKSFAQPHVAINTAINASVNAPAETRRRAERPTLHARLAQGVMDVRLAQRLRADVFGAEFGIHFDSGLDEERLDAYCAHLLVFDGSRLVATTRLLDQHRARLAGGFYTSQEFDLEKLLSTTTAPILEIGRTCVHPDYRSASAINTLWQGIGQVVADWKIDTLMGCASIALGSGDVQNWLNQLPEQQKLSPSPRALRRLPPAVFGHAPALPPLLKAYLRMNAQVGAQACYDPEFHCADVLVWLPLHRMDSRYLSRFGA